MRSSPSEVCTSEPGHWFRLLICYLHYSFVHSAVKRIVRYNKKAAYIVVTLPQIPIDANRIMPRGTESSGLHLARTTIGTFTQRGTLAPQAISTINTLPILMLRHTFTCVLLIALAACSRSERSDENLALSQIEGFPFPIHVQESTGREWREVGLEAIAVIGASEEQMLYQASSIAGTKDGSSYILDYNDMMVKHFNAAGSLVQTYGNGRGEGPGEFGNPMPISIDAEGNVVVPDAVRRSVIRFGQGGELLESAKLDFQPFRMALTDAGRHYFVLSGFLRDEHMFGTSQGLDQALHTFGTSDLEPLGLGGQITTVDDDMIYSPSNYGFIARFSPSGDIVFARETLDPMEPPTFETIDVMGMTGLRFKSRPPGKYILTYFDGYLYMESRVLSAERKNTVMDVYDADEGSYSYSFEVPGRWRDIDVAGNYLFALRDTLGTVFEFRQ